MLTIIKTRIVIQVTVFNKLSQYCPRDFYTNNVNNDNFILLDSQE